MSNALLSPRSVSVGSRAVLALAATACLALVPACGPSADPNMAGRTPVADKWLQRAKLSYKAGDFDDARDASRQALEAAPRDNDIRILSAKVALTRLDFADVIKLTEGMDTSEAHGLRGRAAWYLGDIEQAADELESMLRDPAVKDPWARDIAGLARRGSGRHPFAMEGGLIASVEMPKVGPILIVPCELEGERILAMVATASGEVVVDSNSRKEPAWVNLRFGDRLEVKDVPALTQDLSAISRQFGAPIKALLGVNLLRHIHVTFDRRGDQFIVRREDPAAPPEASRVPLSYVRGGGMLVRVGTGAGKDESKAPFLVDTSVLFPMALEDELWRKAGLDPAKLNPEPSLGPTMKSGLVPSVKIGGFDLPHIPAVQGAPLGDIRSNVDVDLGGVVGAGLLQAFRVTLGDDGRFMWLEPDPGIGGDELRRPGQQPPSGQGAPPAGAPADGLAPTINRGAPPAAPAMTPDPSPTKKPATPASAAPKAAAPKGATTPAPSATGAKK